jgi:carboxylesterase type B
LSSTIIDYGLWAHFAKAGEPPASGLPPWPAYHLGVPMAQQLRPPVEQMPIPRAAKLLAFEEVLKSQLQPVKMQ